MCGPVLRALQPRAREFICPAKHTPATGTILPATFIRRASPVCSPTPPSISASRSIVTEPKWRVVRVLTELVPGAVC